MRRYEVVGNRTLTLGVVLGEFATLGAARRAATKAAENPQNRLKYLSIDVDDGRGNVLFTAVPDRRSLYEGPAWEGAEAQLAAGAVDRSKAIAGGR